MGEGHFSIVFSYFMDNNKGIVALKCSKNNGNDLIKNHTY